MAAQPSLEAVLANQNRLFLLVKININRLFLLEINISLIGTNYPFLDEIGYSEVALDKFCPFPNFSNKKVPFSNIVDLIIHKILI